MVVSVRSESFRCLSSFSPLPWFQLLPPCLTSIRTPQGASLLPALALHSAPTSDSSSYCYVQVREPHLFWCGIFNRTFLSGCLPLASVPPTCEGLCLLPAPRVPLPLPGSSLPPQRKKTLTLYFCSCCYQLMSTCVPAPGTMCDSSAPLERAVHLVFIGRSGGPT